MLIYHLKFSSLFLKCYIIFVDVQGSLNGYKIGANSVINSYSCAVLRPQSGKTIDPRFHAFQAVHAYEAATSETKRIISYH